MANKKKITRGGLSAFCGGRVTQACIDRAKRGDDEKLKLKALFAETLGAAGSRKKAQAGTHVDPQLAAQLEGLQQDPNAVGASVDSTVPNADATATTATTADAADATGGTEEEGGGGGIKDALANTASDALSLMTPKSTGPISSGRTSNKQIAGQAGGAALDAAMNTKGGIWSKGIAALGAGTMAAIKAKKIQGEQKAEKLQQSQDLLQNLDTATAANLESGVVGPNTGFTSGKGANAYLPGQAGSNMVARYGTRKKVAGGEKIDIGFGNYKFVGNEHGESGDGSSSGIVDGSTTTEVVNGKKVTRPVEVEHGEVEVNYKRKKKGGKKGDKKNSSSEEADKKSEDTRDSFILSNHLKDDDSDDTIAQAYLKEILQAQNKMQADAIARKYVDMNEESSLSSNDLSNLAAGNNMLQAMLGTRKLYQDGTPPKNEETEKTEETGPRKATQEEIDAAYKVLAADPDETRTLKEIISDTVNAPIRESNKVKEAENKAKKEQYEADLKAYDEEEARVAEQKAAFEEKGKTTADRRADQAASSRKNVYGNVDDAGVESFFKENADYYDFGDVMQDGEYDSAAADEWLADKSKREGFVDHYGGVSDAERVTGNIDALGTKGADLFGEQFSGARLRKLQDKPMSPEDYEELGTEEEVDIEDVSICPNGDPCPDGDCSRCPQPVEGKTKMRPTGTMLGAIPALMQKDVNPKLAKFTAAQNVHTGRENLNALRQNIQSGAQGTKDDMSKNLSGPAAIAAKMNVDANSAEQLAKVSAQESASNIQRSGQEKGINAKIAADNAARYGNISKFNTQSINDSKYYNENSDRAKNELIANTLRDRRREKLDFDQDIFDSRATQVDGEFDRALTESYDREGGTAGYAKRGRQRRRDRRNTEATTPGADAALRNQGATEALAANNPSVEDNVIAASNQEGVVPGEEEKVEARRGRYIKKSGKIRRKKRSKRRKK
jgi:hypothetical protein